VNARVPALLAQRRFQRYVAVLLAVTVPALATVDFIQSPVRGFPLLWVPYGVLTAWALRVAIKKDAKPIPLILATMVYVGCLTVGEALLGVQVTAFDFTSAYGLMLVLSVLTAGLVVANRLVWAVGMSLSVAVWSGIIGYLESGMQASIAVRSLVAVASVVLATAVLSDLFDQLADAADEHHRVSRLQDAIAKCSEALLVHSDSCAVHEAARAMLDATSADYVYIDRTTLVDGQPGWEIIADAGSSVDKGGWWKTGKYSDIPTIYEALSSGRAIVIRPEVLGPEERQLYEDDRIKTEVSVPIFLGSTMRGSIGFIQYSKDRSWTDSEIQALWRAAHMIAAYWRRQDDAARLRASNESKDRLLASVSHEIRTPLTAIVGLSEELISSRSSLGQEEVDELNGIIAVQSRELAELVEDLLVASRADFGNLSIRPEEVDLGHQVSKVVEGTRESNPAPKEVMVDGGPVLAWADPLRVRQVVRNLLTNAVRYGGDRIVIRVEQRHDRALVIVADDGAGVPESEEELIFERYYRSAQSPTLPGSVGIGLPLSRQLAEMMGGSLEYVGGDYPRFELSLPAMPAGNGVTVPAGLGLAAAEA
jgi:signal transduction histidine kinase